MLCCSNVEIGGEVTTLGDFDEVSGILLEVGDKEVTTLGDFDVEDGILGEADKGGTTVSEVGGIIGVGTTVL